MNTFGWTLVAAPCLALATFNSPSPIALFQFPADSRGAADDAREWRERLQNEDLDIRERDFGALIEQARGSEEARARLEAWARDREHPDFAWSARLALRELNAGAGTARGRSEDPFEALRQGMFRDRLGNDLFNGFLLLDPSSPGFGGAHGWSDPFQNWPPGSGAGTQADAFTLEMGPDGVKVRVKKSVDGKEHEEEYSAKTLDELLRAHPELSPRLRGGSSSLGGNFGLRFGLPGFDFDRALEGGLRTDVLGVYLESEPAQDGSASAGLRIVRVQPGSLAEKLGLEAGETLIKLNGRALKTRDDISSVLRERKSDQGLDVEVRDDDGKVSTRSWQPSKGDRGAAHPLLPGSPRNTRKI